MLKHYLTLLFFLLFSTTGLSVSLSQASIKDSNEYPDRVHYLQCQGALAEAVELARKYVGEEKQKFGADHKKTYEAIWVLGQALFMNAEYNEASSVLASGLSGYEKLVGADSHVLRPYLESLSTLLFTMSRYPEAQKLAARVNKLKY